MNDPERHGTLLMNYCRKYHTFGLLQLSDQLMFYGKGSCQ